MWSGDVFWSSQEKTMETLEAIQTRRSVRKYLDKPVPEDLLQKLLAAVMQAPSARNPGSS
jgi:nitroreductase